MILPGTAIDCARLVAERTRLDISKTVFRYDGKESSLTVSIGVAQLMPNEQVSRILQRVDQAMYESKKAGRNRTYWHDGRAIHPVLEESAAVPPAEKLAAAIPQIVMASESGNAALHLSSPGPASRRTMAQPNQESPEAMGFQCDRTAFCGNVRQRIAEWKRGGSTFCVLLVRIEQYEHGVDAPSQETIDNVLRAVTQILHGVLREMDSIGRYAPACFGVLLPGTTLQGGMVVADRVREGIDFSSPTFDRGLVQFTLSVGVAEVAEGDDAIRLLQRAKAMMTAAEKNRSCRLRGQWPEGVTNEARLQVIDLSVPGTVGVGDTAPTHMSLANFPAAGAFDDVAAPPCRRRIARGSRQFSWISAIQVANERHGQKSGDAVQCRLQVPRPIAPAGEVAAEMPIVSARSPIPVEPQAICGIRYDLDVRWMRQMVYSDWRV